MDKENTAGAVCPQPASPTRTRTTEARRKYLEKKIADDAIGPLQMFDGVARAGARLTHYEARVALVLISRANHDTLDCDPSIAGISKDSGIECNRLVRLALRGLEYKKLVVRDFRPGARTRYTLVPEAICRLELD